MDNPVIYNCWLQDVREGRNGPAATELVPKVFPPENDQGPDEMQVAVDASFNAMRTGFLDMTDEFSLPENTYTDIEKLVVVSLPVVQGALSNRVNDIGAFDPVSGNPEVLSELGDVEEVKAEWARRFSASTLPGVKLRKGVALFLL